MQDRIGEIELEIDNSFAANPLIELPYDQAVWTLLSVLEDRHLKHKVISPLPDGQLAIFMDTTINAVTYPLRVCFNKARRSNAQVNRKLVDVDYAHADQWLDEAEDYGNFSSIFPLFHAGKIDLAVDSMKLVPIGWEVDDYSAEAYNRLVGKTDPLNQDGLDPNLAIREIAACLTTSGRTFSLQYTRKLLAQITKSFESCFNQRHTLPSGWAFSHFNLVQFRRVVSCLQCMAYSWFIARQLALDKGVTALGYCSSVWMPRKSVLVSTIAKHTTVAPSIVTEVLKYLTFGEMGIRNPDIAVQPIVELSGNLYAIAPFLLIHVNAERNLCVLLNQIPPERDAYSRLVHDKEEQLRQRTIRDLHGHGFKFKSGGVSNTDVDLAIIDHEKKVCICIEMKWFIEPAEIREMLTRSEELSKGVLQCQKIEDAFRRKDGRLLGLLEINEEYKFLAIVGSENFIGRPQVQHPQVPIVKIWHLISEIRKHGRLDHCYQWLNERQYLPRKGVDFDIHKIPLQCGNWTSEWYGIGPPENAT